MAKKEAKPAAAELDEHGLVVHKYVSTVLVVVPPRDFSETAMRYVRSALYNVHVGTLPVTTDDTGLLEGELQDLFEAEGRVQDVDMADFSGIVLCGGPGVLALADDPHVLGLVRDAAAQDKLICAWGLSVLLLARAGVVKGRKLTGDPALESELRRAGARYTGAQVQVDEKIVTALDDAAGFRMGKALVQVVRIL